MARPVPAADGAERLGFGAIDLGRLLETVVGHVDQGVSVWDAEQRLVLYNRRYATLLRLPAALLAPGTPMRAVGAAMDARGDFGGRSVDALIDRALERLAAEGRYRVTRRFGAELWLQTDWSALPDGGIVVTLTDVTALKTTERARANLARHVPANMVATLAAADDPFGPPREQAIAVLFVDMIGFTGFAASRPPADFFAVLREFHALLARAVDRHGGTLDKFTGDGIMATFGTPVAGPRDAANALDCARAIATAIAAWNEARAVASETPVRIGVGLHWGAALMGAIGDRHRLEFAVLGDTVNVASRLERLAGELGLEVAASAAAIDAARAQGASLEGLRDAGPRALRGRAEPVAVWTFAASS